MDESPPGRRLLTGRTLSIDADPTTNPGAVRYVEKGAVLVEDGMIVWVGPAGDIPSRQADGAARHDYGDGLIMPGFVDGHVH